MLICKAWHAVAKTFAICGTVKTVPYKIKQYVKINKSLVAPAV